ncbi:hypothetical protein HPB52_009909 [Rhipicephalus sanguineus]|uniref:Uncharacterized protein n=1 Tax=Rhipicephalus sanguineus TaxID=34632 RepID=A0A9D4PZ63_RHISA|nr:hypothetical protein HPB52_009909 [Rhipicephalus sanguineus]
MPEGLEESKQVNENAEDKKNRGLALRFTEVIAKTRPEGVCPSSPSKSNEKHPVPASIPDAGAPAPKKRAMQPEAYAGGSESQRLTFVDHELSGVQMEHALIELVPTKRRKESIFLLNVYSSPSKQRQRFRALLQKKLKIAGSRTLIEGGDFNAADTADPNAVLPSNFSKMSELPRVCPSNVPTLPNLASSAENDGTFIEIQQEPTDEIVVTTETAESEPESTEYPSGSQLLKTAALPVASLLISLPEGGDAILASHHDVDKGTIASMEDETKDRLDDEEPSLEDLHCLEEGGMLSSSCTAPWPRQLGLDKRGRSYWPGRYPQVSVFLPRSNCPASEPSWWGRERVSLPPQASMVADGSCVYLYGRTSRVTPSPAENGGKASRACLATFVFVVVMLCVWMFQAVGEYRVPESALYSTRVAPSANKVKGAGGTYAGEVLADADDARRAGDAIKRISSYYDSEDTMDVGDGREKTTRKTAVRMIPRQV